MEFKTKEDDLKYELYMYDIPFQRISLHPSQIINLLEINVAGKGRRHHNYAFALKTNDLWELLEWVEKLKRALSFMYREYGSDKEME